MIWRKALAPSVATPFRLIRPTDSATTTRVTTPGSSKDRRVRRAWRPAKRFPSPNCREAIPDRCRLVAFYAVKVGRLLAALACQLSAVLRQAARSTSTSSFPSFRTDGCFTISDTTIRTTTRTCRRFYRSHLDRSELAYVDKIGHWVCDRSLCCYPHGMVKKERERLFEDVRRAYMAGR